MIIETLFLLAFAHALADFPLQGEHLATAKRRSHTGSTPWQLALLAHALIHAGFVLLITESVTLGLFELVAHAAIDFAKCEGYLGKKRTAFWVDQLLHGTSKVAWVAILIAS